MDGEAFKWPSLMLVAPFAGCALSVGIAMIWISTRLLLEPGNRREMQEKTAQIVLFLGFVFLAVFVFLIVYAVSKDLFTQHIGI